jgi:hypothetical protein
VDDVLAEEVVGDVDPLGKDAIEDAHLRLRLEAHPRHVAVLEVIEDGDLVLLEDRNVVIEVLTLERVGDDRLVLDTDLVGEAAPRQRLDGPFELPRASCSPPEGKVPGDVVLQDRGLARCKRLGDARGGRRDDRCREESCRA